MIELWIKTSNGLNLKTYVDNPNQSLTAFIFCHGFPANSNFSFYPRMAEILAKDNLVCRFDFRGQGNSDGTFYDSSIKHEIEDLGHMIKYVKQNYNPQKIVLLTHSFGTIIAMLHLAEEDSSLVSALVSLSGEGDLTKAIDLEFNSNQLQDLREKGETQVFNWGARREELLGKQFLEEMKEYSTVEAAKKLTLPIMFFHGTKDESVPVSATTEMHSLVNGPKSLHLVTDASHNYDFFMKPQLIEDISTKILAWVKTV